MWKYVLPPVLVVAAFWVVISVATNFYVEWIEQSYHRIFQENLTSIQLANDFDRSARRLEYAWPRDNTAISSVRSLCESTIHEMDECARDLQATSLTPAEVAVMKELSGVLSSLRTLSKHVFSPADSTALSSISSAQFLTWEEEIHELIKKLSASASELKSINQEVIDRSVSSRPIVSDIVRTVRMAFLLIGPLLGVWLGWRLAKRLHKSVARIAVTLQQSSGDEIDVGTVTLESDGVLSEMQQQAQKIVDRLKSTHRELEQARSEVVRSERLAAVGQLAAGVAHEIRNPLTSVKLLLQHAALQPDKHKLTEDKLQLILNEIARMETTIEGLLDFSRQRALHTTHHDLREILLRAFNLIDARAKQHKIEVVVKSLEEPFIVNADAELVHQVFVNLLINAIEAMPDGGALTVTAAVVDNGQRIQIKVRDTGPGIHEELIPRLFEPFATTKESGTGLGLAVSRRIIDQHNGTLIASNDPSIGAVFTVELPRVTTLTTVTKELMPHQDTLQLARKAK